MNEFEKHLPVNPDQEIVESTIPEKKLQHLGSYKFQKGHKLFKMELSTSFISEVDVVFETPAYEVDSVDLKKRKKVRGENFIKLLNHAADENKGNKRMKLIPEEGFIYCTALNKKNALKRFIRLLSSK